MNYLIKKIRSNFPILSTIINFYPLVYLDSAATSQKPNEVIYSQSNYYLFKNAPIHRGVYTLSNEVTNSVESVRLYISKFINAKFVSEIIFVHGSTHGINLVSNSWGRYFLKFFDNIVLTEMEHHSNIIPWQILAKEKKIFIHYIPLLNKGFLNISKLHFLVNKYTKIVSLTHLSNVLGILNPLLVLVSIIRILSNSVIFIDGAQGIAHCFLDVQILDIDFYVFSSHKIYGPLGIGVLYVKKSILNIMPPFEGGGGMVSDLNLTNGLVSFNYLPFRFEAGSLNTVSIIGLGHALKYILNLGLVNIYIYEYELMRYTLIYLNNVFGFILYGLYDRLGVISFNINKYHSYDISCVLDQFGISIRTGHHCAIPLMLFFCVFSMCRISLALYTNINDVNFLINILYKLSIFIK